MDARKIERYQHIGPILAISPKSGAFTIFCAKQICNKKIRGRMKEIFLRIGLELYRNNKNVYQTSKIGVSTFNCQNEHSVEKSASAFACNTFIFKNFSTFESL